MREKMLIGLAKLHVNHPWRMLSIVFILTIIFMALAEQLDVTMRWSDLLPSGDRRTVQFNKIIEEFVSSTSIIVVVQGEENQIKQFADELAPKLLAAIDTTQNAKFKKKIEEKRAKIKKLRKDQADDPQIARLETEISELSSRINKQLIQRVDYKMELGFLKNHGLMLLKEENLRDIKDIFYDPNLTGLLFNLNNAMEKEYVGQDESISTREKEDQAVAFLDGIQNLVQVMRRYAQQENVPQDDAVGAVDKLLLGEPYFLSYDKKALLLNAIPNFTMFDTDLLVDGTVVVQGIVDDLLKKYPGVTAGLTGFIPIGHDEMVYSEKSLGYTTVIALIAILILLIFTLRMWLAPVFAILNLIIGIIWAVGTATVIVGQLNIMTQMMAVILLGLGIDFSIHLISNFTEWRALGHSISESMENTFLKSGKGVVTGALTTAFAFLTLVISSSRGMKEMGLVTGFGLIAILVATFLLLPILLVFRERRIDQKRGNAGAVNESIQKDISFRFLGSASLWLSKRYIFTLAMALILTALLTWSATNITFDQNYMNVEAEGLTSIALQDTVLDKFDMSMDYALILTDNVAESRKFAKQYRDKGTVAMTEDISFYLPSQQEQQQRVPHILEIREAMESALVRNSVSAGEIPDFIQEIERLKFNVMEMQTLAIVGVKAKVDKKCTEILGQPEKEGTKNLIQELQELVSEDKDGAARGFSNMQKVLAPYFKESVLKMSSTEPIALSDLPVTILDRYSNNTRDQFLVTVFPSGNLWQDADFLDRFVNDLESVTPKATGMPPVFKALIDIIGKDGRNAMILTLVIIFLLLWLDFRSIRYSLMAMIPLAIGLFWMVGLMHLTGQQFTVMNIMGLPMILGIGIDDGVHVIHRWQIEGAGKINTVFSSTGKAILLTSLTTMLAFGSLIFSIWRGFGQLGAALFVGVAACFLTTVIVLPGIMGWIESRKNLKN
ncbi:MMPL family transporter [candidate division KSB1 bacterium]|nr:MMPL family transporter [candidate division KSB1 bacterium]